MKSLIANSGIQSFRFQLQIDPNEDVIRAMRFYEWYEPATFQMRLEYAYYLNSLDVLVSKKSLYEEGYIDENGKIDEDQVNITLLKELRSGEDTYSINDIETCLELFDGKWLPLPLFETDNAQESSFGPTGWSRFKIDSRKTENNLFECSITLLIDTKIDSTQLDNTKPVLYQNEASKIFGLCSNENLLLDFFNPEKNCEWVNQYLAEVVYGGTDKVPQDFPTLKYLGYYIFLISYLQAKVVFPQFKLYNDVADDKIDVDLVLDIGNSRTCGLLFESGELGEGFNKVKKLQLRDLTDFSKIYLDPFSMRLAFHKADFGEMNLQSNQFTWPSILRIGEEATNLIFQSRNQDVDQKNKVTSHSSPKRYLWDNNKSSQQWEFIVLGGASPMKSIYLEGIAEQFNSDGSFNPTTDFGVESAYSRKSLMTFVFLEILAHTHVQINSHDFRTEHDNFSSPRRIRSILVTCPTAMPQSEQITLRQCAQEAAVVIERFFNDLYAKEWNPKEIEKPTEVIPSVKDLNLKISDLSDRRDWGYDEATCCQLVYLYAEVSKRYLNNCIEYFELYGKTRNDLQGYSGKSVTIGSIDIGAGTTDLMICAYQFQDSGKAVLTPIPLFWESFNHAGDDLLKQIIQQVIIEGEVKDENYRGSVGVIQNHMTECGINNVHEKLNTFFGENSNKMNFQARQMRREFNIQVAIPIALTYLLKTQNKEKDSNLTFNELFPNNKPKPELLDYFFEHFGFRFEDINWKFCLNRINEIIVSEFEPLLEKVSGILYAQGCDIVLLAGKPMSLGQVEDLFFKFFPVSPDRIISLNKYRVGKWYPFADGNGYFEDQKSIVAVGAMIGYLGGIADKLPGFRLNMDWMKRKLLSTAKCFGVYNEHTKYSEESFITPEMNRNSIEVSGLPMIFGSKQLNISNYTSKPFYVLDFNVEQIEEIVSSQRDEVQSVSTDVDKYIERLLSRMPFKIKISREFRVDREHLVIESIVDNNRDEVPTKVLQIKQRSLPNEKGYWLDTGEFVLSVGNKML